MFRIVSTTLALALVAVPARAAEEGNGYIDVGAGVGVLAVSNAHQLGSTTLFPPRLKERLPALDPGLSLEGRVGFFWNRWVGVEGGFGWAPLSLQTGGSANVLHARGSLVVQVPVDDVDIFLAGGGAAQGVSSSVTTLGDDWDGAVHLGAGVKWHVADGLQLRCDVRDNMSMRFTGAFPANSLEVLAGAAWTMGPLLVPPKPPKDTDFDGLPDEKDQCPDRPAITDTGCPLDSDGDTIVDSVDKCPKVAAKTADGCPPPDTDRDGIVDEKDKCPTENASTPDGCPVRDADGDGVPDEKDECKDIAASQENGCPPDDDGDRVWNANDKCPSVSSPNTPDGCPPDGDKDGKPDASDKCPDVASAADDGCPFGDPDKDGLTDDVDACDADPENVNLYLDEDGCIDAIPKDLAKLVGVVGGLTFAKGAALAKPADGVLKVVAKALAAYPDAALEITVHLAADKKSTPDAQRELSVARAGAIREALVKKGVAGERITAKGAGIDEPVDTSGKPAAAKKNERIVFKWIGKAK